MINLFGRKYYLNPETLRYEKVRLTRGQTLRYGLIFGAGLVLLAVLLRNGFERYYPTPKQIKYEHENAKLRKEYFSLNSNLEQVESQLAELRDRDDRFYRAILGLDPVAASIRKAGTGGSEPYSQFSSIRNPGLVKDVLNRIDQINNRVMIQSTSLENVLEQAISQKEYLACKPSINPLSPADPHWMTSSYGYRKDPFTKQRAPHHGIDLAGPYGLEIHCTGDGVVKLAHINRHGYGKEVVVDHGFGFSTRYAHLDEILVKPGQKLKRGQVLGTMGNSGRSTGPHLHYEVRKDNRPVNPMYYFFENLTSKEYSLLAANAVPVAEMAAAPSP